MTMDEIREVLTNKARLEAEDAQRVLLAALNGLAALMLLEGSRGDAVKAYREVSGAERCLLCSAVHPACFALIVRLLRFVSAGGKDVFDGSVTCDIMRAAWLPHCCKPPGRHQPSRIASHCSATAGAFCQAYTANA